MKNYLVVIALLAAFTSLVAFAATPTELSYQGFLTDSGGDPVVDGSYSIVFTIYDAASGGASKWTETQNVTTVDGLFSTLLGSVNPILDTVFADSGRWLGLAVDGDPEISPRTKLTSSAFAFRVARLDGAYGGTITGDVDIQGDARIGTGHGTSGSESFVAGRLNTASGFRSTVSGGSGNVADGANSTVGGGSSNDALGDRATVAGGHSNTASGDTSTVAGGSRNTASGDHATVGGGQHNEAAGDYSFTAGYADSIHADADYSVLFGIDSDLTQDSTFMVDMPHVRIGDETTGYELPTEDGADGQVLGTDGAGQAGWTSIPIGWNWSDSSSHGPDSVLYADTADYAANAGVATSTAFADSADAITDGAVDAADIADGSITNDDIDASAGIDVTKIDGTAMDLASTQTVTGSKTFDDLKVSATTRYLALSSAAFDPQIETTDYSRGIDAAIRGDLNGVFVRFFAPVELPHGAEITDVRISVSDYDGAQNLSAILQRKSQSSSDLPDLMSGISSSGSPGFAVFSDSTIAFPVVDNDAYFYFASVYWQPTTSTQIYFYGMTIVYEITEPLP